LGENGGLARGFGRNRDGGHQDFSVGRGSGEACNLAGAEALVGLGEAGFDGFDATGLTGPLVADLGAGGDGLDNGGERRRTWRGAAELLHAGDDLLGRIRHHLRQSVPLRESVNIHIGGLRAYRHFLGLACEGFVVDGHGSVILCYLSLADFLNASAAPRDVV
jgi:hypothetical protein